jgi:cAMP and cAMP-inhibited cGMP 3',5'-cyclic phosphodiesterase 10
MAHIVKKRHGHRQKSKAKVQRPDHQIAPKIIKEKSVVWRVIAPFVTVPKKNKEQVEDEQFSFYLKKKPAVLIRDLSSFMSDSVDLPSLFHETSDVLKKVTKASWVTLYLVDRATNEIYQSQSFAVKDRHRVKWKIEDGSIVAAYVANIKEYVLVEDVFMDGRFSEGVGYEGNTRTSGKSSK